MIKQGRAGEMSDHSSFTDRRLVTFLDKESMTDYPVTLVPYFGPETQPAMDKKRGKLIVQIARTNCAGAIWRIHDAINTYTEHTCRTITASDMTNGRKYPHDIFLNQIHEVKHLLSKADVIHFHNWIDHESPEMVPFRHLFGGKRLVLQYHTEPALLQRQYRRDVVTRDDITTLVIAQKHLRFYPKSIPVPNMIDIWDPRLMPVSRNNPRLKVIYTPSDLKAYAVYGNTCCGKGYPQVLPVLKKLQAEGIIDFDVITDKTWEELMPIKQRADVCIDECVTGGYHLCSLEALSQGLATIAWLDEKTQEAIHRIVGFKTELPWANTMQSGLEARLRGLAADPNILAGLKDYGRRWMVENWSPQALVQHFLNAYWPTSMPKPQPKEVSQVVVAPGTLHQRWGQSNQLQRVYQVPGIMQPECKALAGAWAGKRVIIWGNGPSVIEAQALRLDAKHIGTNAATKIEGVQFDAYCIGDRRFLEVPEKREIALTAPGVRIYNSVIRPFLPPGLVASFIETIGRDGFCSDLTKGVYHGYSVAYFALQVAVWTGAKDILLAGCGHDYNPKQPRFYKENVVSEIDDTFPRILNNYRLLMPALAQMGVSVKTIGKSRLADAGVKQFLP
jgi:hypothetical protein